VDLTSYAELAVRLVNTGDAGAGRDELATTEAYQTFTADRAFLHARVTPGDLDALRQLRGELRLIFADCGASRDTAAVARLNALLARHPTHPEIARHDGQPSWHLHHAESGSAADKYAAAAVLGLTSVITELGPDRLRRCAETSCQKAYVDRTDGRSQDYCGDHGMATASVTALRDRRRSPDSGQASTAAV
jgi:predicted RNA-binding Zn ribbon-like protein